jgi:hypothetical protein
MNRKKAVGIAVLIVLFLGGVAGGYLYFSKVILSEKASSESAGMLKSEDLFSLRMYYPVGDHLQIEERRLPRRILPMAIAEAAVEQYLRGPVDAKASAMPRDAKLLSLYLGADGILYVDLKGLYQSIISNVEDVQDVKVLIEGKETETLGGHLYLLYPLRDMVSYEFKYGESTSRNQPATVFGKGGTGRL